MDVDTEQPIMLVFPGFSVYAFMVQGFCRDKSSGIGFFLFSNSEINKFMHKWEVNSKQNEALHGKQISKPRSLILRIVIVTVICFLSEINKLRHNWVVLNKK